MYTKLKIQYFSLFFFIFNSLAPVQSFAVLSQFERSIFNSIAEQIGQSYQEGLTESQRKLIYRNYLNKASAEFRKQAEDLLNKNNNEKLKNDTLKQLSVYLNYFTFLDFAYRGTPSMLSSDSRFKELSKEVSEIFEFHVKLKETNPEDFNALPSKTKELLSSALASGNHGIQLLKIEPEAKSKIEHKVRPKYVVLLGERHVKNKAASQEGISFCQHFPNKGVELGLADFGVVSIMAKLSQKVKQSDIVTNTNSRRASSFERFWYDWISSEEPYQSTVFDAIHFNMKSQPPRYGLLPQGVTPLEAYRKRWEPTELFTLSQPIVSGAAVLSSCAVIYNCLATGTVPSWQTNFLATASAYIVASAGAQYIAQRYFPNSKLCQLLNGNDKSCLLRSQHMADRIHKTIMASPESSGAHQSPGQETPFLAITGAAHTPEIGEHLETKYGYKDVRITPQQR